MRVSWCRACLADLRAAWCLPRQSSFLLRLIPWKGDAIIEDDLCRQSSGHLTALQSAWIGFLQLASIAQIFDVSEKVFSHRLSSQQMSPSRVLEDPSPSAGCTQIQFFYVAIKVSCAEPKNLTMALWNVSSTLSEGFLLFLLNSHLPPSLKISRLVFQRYTLSRTEYKVVLALLPRQHSDTFTSKLRLMV